MFVPGTVIDWQKIGIVLVSLFLVCSGYAWLVYRLGGRKSGYVSVFVAVGVAITLAGAAFIDWRAALLMLICFAASGTPMIAGEFITSMLDRDAAYRAAQEAIKDAYRGMEGGDDQP